MTAKALSRFPSATGIQFEPIPGPLGATMHGFDLRDLDEASFDAIRRATLDHLILICRGQSFEPGDLVNLIKRFGTPVTSSGLHAGRVEERVGNDLYNIPPEVTMMTNLMHAGKPLGALGDAEVVWHSDFSFKERPTAVRILVAGEVPPPESGGCTWFSNCYAAYDTLSDAQKKRISGKTVKQANILNANMKLRPGAHMVKDVRDAPGPSHPLISTHPATGANLLFLGRRHSAYVNGLSVEESEELLDDLWDHATQDRFIYVHKWQAGDVVIWDNRATLHRREAFDPSLRRILYAAQVEGHRPIEAPGALALEPHPRWTA